MHRSKFSPTAPRWKQPVQPGTHVFHLPPAVFLPFNNSVCIVLMCASRIVNTVWGHTISAKTSNPTMWSLERPTTKSYYTKVGYLELWLVRVADSDFRLLPASGRVKRFWGFWFFFFTTNHCMIHDNDHWRVCGFVQKLSGLTYRSETLTSSRAFSPPRRLLGPSWRTTARPWATLWRRRTNWHWSSTARRWSTRCPSSSGRPSSTWRCPARLSSAAGKKFASKEITA